MNWKKRQKEIRYFSRLGGFLHHVRIRSATILFPAILALLTSLRPVLAQTDADSALDQYLKVIRSLKQKGVTNLSGDREFAKRSDDFIQTMGAEVKKLTLENKFSEALGILAAMKELGELYKDSALTASVDTMKNEVSEAQWTYHRNRAPAVLKGATSHNLRDIGEVSVKGTAWEYNIVKKGNGFEMGLSVTKRLAQDVPVKVTRQEVKEAVDKHNLTKDQKEALETEIINMLRRQEVFED